MPAACLIRAPLAATAADPAVLTDVEIAVEAGRIIEIRPARRGPVDIELSGRVLMPGLINAHVHSEFLLLKGLLEDMRLVDWEGSGFFKRAWAWIKAADQVEQLRPVYRASYLEMLLGGITFVAEFNCADAAVTVSREALDEVGLHGVPTLDFDRRDGWEAIEADGCLYALNDEEELSTEELIRARDLLAERDVRFTMHAAETAERMQLVLDRFGETTIRLLDRYGLLGPHMLLSHAVYLTDEEIDLIVARRAPVVASASAEAKLADGIAPSARLLAAGATLALGTDAAVCNNGCDMFVEMRTLGLLQKAVHGAGAVSARSLLEMATIGGAKALGLEASRGSLELGKQADIVAVDSRSLRMAPLVHGPRRSNVIPNLVYCAGAADVTDVFVAGERLVSAGRHTRLDTGSALAELHAISAALEAHLDRG